MRFSNTSELILQVDMFCLSVELAKNAFINAVMEIVIVLLAYLVRLEIC